MASMEVPSSNSSFLRVNIADIQSHTPLFDRVWKWKAAGQGPSGIASLVQFFFQFAREMDDGALSRVVFESPAEVARHHTSVGASSTGGMKSALARAHARRRSAVTQYGVEMVATNAESVTVCVFYSTIVKKKYADDFLKRIAAAFLEKYKDTLAELAPEFKEASKNKEMANLNLAYIPKFESFSGDVDKLKADVEQLSPPVLYNPGSHNDNRRRSASTVEEEKS